MKDYSSQKLSLIDTAIEKVAGSEARIFQFREQIKQKLLENFSCTPGHPAYAAMIQRAIAESRRKGGMSEEEISDFICQEYKDTNLAAAHSSMLKIHLAKLCKKGEIVCTVENRYIFPVEDSDSWKTQKCSHQNFRKCEAEKNDRSQEVVNVVHPHDQNAGYDHQIKEVEGQSHSQEGSGRPGLIDLWNNQAMEEKNDSRRLFEKGKWQVTEENHIVEGPASEGIKENDKSETGRTEDISEEIEVRMLDTQVLEERAEVIAEGKNQARDGKNEPSSELHGRLVDQTMAEHHYLEEPVGEATEEQDKRQTEESVKVLESGMALSRMERNPERNNTPQFTMKQVENEAAMISLPKPFLASQNFKDSIPEVTLMKSTIIGMLKRTKEIQQDLENAADFLGMLDGSNTRHPLPVMDVATTDHLLKKLSDSVDVLTGKMRGMNLERSLEFTGVCETFSPKQKTQKQLCDQQMVLHLKQNSIPTSTEPDYVFSDVTLDQELDDHDNHPDFNSERDYQPDVTLTENSVNPDVRHLKRPPEHILPSLEKSSPHDKQASPDDCVVPLAFPLKPEFKEKLKPPSVNALAHCGSHEPGKNREEHLQPAEQLLAHQYWRNDLCPQGQGQVPHEEDVGQSKVEQLPALFPRQDQQLQTEGLFDARKLQPQGPVHVPSCEPEQQQPRHPRQGRPPKRKFSDMGETLPLNDQDYIRVQSHQSEQQQIKHLRRGRTPTPEVTDHNHMCIQSAQPGQQLPQHPRRGRPPKSMYTNTGQSLPLNEQKNHNEELRQRKRVQGRPRKDEKTENGKCFPAEQSSVHGKDNERQQRGRGRSNGQCINFCFNEEASIRDCKPLSLLKTVLP